MRAAGRRSALLIALLLGALLAGPAHQVLHLVEGHDCGTHGHVGHGHHAPHTVVSRAEATPSTDEHRPSIHDDRESSHDSSAGHCLLCGLVLDLPVPGALASRATPVPCAATEVPADGCRAIRRDRTVSERGPPRAA